MIVVLVAAIVAAVCSAAAGALVIELLARTVLAQQPALRYRLSLVILAAAAIAPMAATGGSVVRGALPHVAMTSSTMPVVTRTLAAQSSASLLATHESARSSPLRWDIDARSNFARATSTSVGAEVVRLASFVWLMGFAIGALRIFRSLRAMRRIKNGARPGFARVASLPRDAAVLTTIEVTAPACVGYFRPVVLVPEWFFAADSDGTEDVLAHEAAHLARYDDWTLLLERACCSALWFHPAAHAIARRMDTDRELACDDIVVGQTNEPRRYALALLRCAESALTGRRDIALAFANRGLGERVARVLAPRRNQNRAGAILASTIVGALVVSGIALPAITTPAFALAAPALHAGTPMLEARSDQTATLLSNGKVLIAGGMVRNGEFLRTAELYDPQTRRFEATGPMAVARVGAAATLLANGRVLVAGGLTASTGGTIATNSAELYDPGSGRFLALPPMTEPRAEFCATLLRDGRVLLTGGENGDGSSSATAEVFDPRNERFTRVASMREARGNHAAVLLADGRVLVAGGDYGYRLVRASTELFDPATNRFTPAGSMSVPRTKLAAVRLPSGNVLVAGGQSAAPDGDVLDSAEIYDVTTQRFVPMGRMHSARYKIDADAVLLRDGRVLVAGGAPGAETYDAATGTFTSVDGALGGDREFGSATVLHDGSVLIAGGYSLPDPAATKTTALYEP